MSDESNNNLILICGKATGGKTASLMGIPMEDHPGVLYFNCEANKGIPFKHNFIARKVSDPYQIHATLDIVGDLQEGIQYPTSKEEQATLNNGKPVVSAAWQKKFKGVHTVVVDTIDFLMDMFESTYCIGSADGRSSWGNYQQFFRALMQKKVTRSNKLRFVFMAHTLDAYSETTGITHSAIKVKGALMANGIEAFFSHIVTARNIPQDVADEHMSEHLTKREHDNGIIKYVFQVNITEDTQGERIRSPIGMWNPKTEIYVNNDINILFKRITEFYNDGDDSPLDS